MDEATVQRMINTAVQAATAQFAATMAQNQQGQQSQQNVPPNTGAAPPPPAGAGRELSLRQPQFRARDIGYFDPAPGPAIEVKDNHNIYHNVFSFTNRLRVKATTMDPTVLRQNLDSCLLGAAENWYTNELAHLSRIGLRNDNDGVKEWCNALEARFRDSPSKSLVALEAIRYTVRDARSRRDPLDYVSTLVLHAKNAGITPTEAAQVMLAYEHIDGQLRLHLPRPQDNSTISGLLEELRHQKDIWFDIYGNDSRQMTRPEVRNDKGKQPQGNNPFRSNFNSNSKPYGNFPYGGKGFASFGGAPRPPYFGGGNSSPNPYRPFIPYGNNPQFNSQSSGNNQDKQATQVQQRQLPGGRQQLQITSGRENANTSTGNNRQQFQQNGNNRNPFRPLSNNQQNQRRPFARAYQHDAGD